MKNICQCLLNLLTFMTFRNGKAQDKKFESFYNKHLKFLPKYFAENGKEKLFPNSSSFVSNLTNVKMNTRHSRFNKSLQTYLLARSNVLHFSTKKESVIIMTMTNFWRKNLAVFHDDKKERFFPYDTVVFYIC